MKTTLLTLSLLIIFNVSTANQYNSVIQKDESYKVSEIIKSVEYSEWINSGAIYDCSEPLPELSTIYFGTPVEQNFECSQDQTRVKSYYNTESLTGEKNLVKTEVEIQTYTTEESIDDVGTFLAASCNEILNSQGSIGNGEYQIMLNSNPVDVYCDMEADGGGWTLVLGVGTEYNKTNSFWNGVDQNDGKQTHYKNYSFSSSISANIIKHLPFQTLKFVIDDNAAIHSSQTISSFSDKNATRENFSGLSWDYVENNGYTAAYFLLGKRDGTISFSDYPGKGLGVHGRATSRGNYYGTQHVRYTGKEKCGNVEFCTYSHNYTSSASLGRSYHRGINGIVISGLFFK